MTDYYDPRLSKTKEEIIESGDRKFSILLLISFVYILTSIILLGKCETLTTSLTEDRTCDESCRYNGHHKGYYDPNTKCICLDKSKEEIK